MRRTNVSSATQMVTAHRQATRTAITTIASSARIMRTAHRTIRSATWVRAMGHVWDVLRTATAAESSSTATLALSCVWSARAIPIALLARSAAARMAIFTRRIPVTFPTVSRALREPLTFFAGDDSRSREKMQPYVLALLAVLAIIVAGATWRSRKHSERCCFVPTSCDSDADCGTWSCTNGVCIPCNTDSDCVSRMAGARCIEDPNGYPRCVRCAVDADCTGGRACVENACRKTCAADSDCPSDSVCVRAPGGRGVCEVPPA